MQRPRSSYSKRGIVYPTPTKVVFAPDGKLLGAQAVGRDGIDKRIDVLATAIRFGKAVFDLQELELADAPPIPPPKTL